MRKLWIFTAVWLCLAFSCACAPSSPEDETAPTTLHRVLSTETLRVVTCADFPPVIYKDEEGQFRGADQELCQYLADRLEVELEIIDANLADFATILSSGEADLALGGIGVTPARQASMLLSNPYFSREESDHVLVTREYKADNFRTPDDFESVRIGVQKGSLQYDLVCEQLPGTQIVLFSQIHQGQEMLEQGTIEVLVTSGIIWEAMDDSYAPTKFTLSDNTQSYVMAVALGEEEFLAEIKRTADQVHANSLYETWLEEEEEHE